MKPKTLWNRSGLMGWVAALLLLPFATLYTVLPLAAWLAPVFLLRFVRTHPWPIALVGLALAQILGTLGTLRHDYLQPQVSWGFLLAFCSAYGLVLSLPYAIDRWLSPRLTWGRHLVFPLALTVLHYTLSFSPFPTWGNPAYTQVTQLPLVQLAAVTGLWGVVFLMGWSASAINAVWENGFRKMQPLLAWAAVMAAVVLGGSLRLATAPEAPTMRVAGLAPNPQLWSYPNIQSLAQASPSQRTRFAQKSQANLQNLWQRTRQEAQAGAQLVVWAETAAFILQENESQVLQQASALAQELGVYLQVGLGVIGQSTTHPYSQNYVQLFDPSGRSLYQYHKAFPVPLGDAAEIAAGPAQMPLVHTPLGVWASVICFDANQLAYLRQAGQNGASLLMVPANDWWQNRFDHANNHLFRAIENGVSLVRPTAKGLSLVSDPYGRVLAQTDYFGSPQASIVAMVPTQGTPTLYARWGDWAAQLALLFLFGLGLRAWWPHTRPLQTA